MPLAGARQRISAGSVCFSLAFKGIPALGVDMDSRDLRIAQYARSRLKLWNVGLSKMVVSLDTVRLLPAVDLVLLMSVWHHWVREFGLDDATALLREVWERCNSVLVFETGEDEMPPEFGLPSMEPTPREWLQSYLSRQCVDSAVVH